MSRRLASLGLALYPLAFRRRYGEEMRAWLEDSPVGARTVVDLLRGAVVEHLRPPAGLSGAVTEGERLRLSVAAVLACWVAFAAAGFGYYITTEDGPLPSAGYRHPLLGETHQTIQVVAVLASLAIVLGALPLIACALALALARARVEGGALRRLVAIPPAVVIAFCLLTELVALLSHGNRHGVGSTLDGGAFVVWGLSGLACGAIIVRASRAALFAVDVPRGRLLTALGGATLVTAGMLAIAIALAVYAIVLQVDTPRLAASSTGPLAGTPTLAVLLVQLAVMLVAGGLAVVAAARGWRAVIAPRGQSTQ